MLIVICGAGASYDSVPSHPPKSSAWADIDRLPLADELFDVRPEFVRMMNQFPACLPIIPNLQHLAAGSSVESELEELQKEAKTNLRRNEQLSAIRFYLQGMIWECEDRWRTKVAQGRTNYRTMLDRIEHWRATQKPHPPSVCFITFNYDRMLEDALSTLGIRTETLEDYVADDVYKLVKLHGSVNWVRTIKVRIPLLQMENNPFQLANELIANSSLLSIGPIDRIVSSYPMSIERSAIPFPAMAIPLQSKSGEYECPTEHVDAAIRCVSEATRVIIIGWKGAEDHFQRLLREKLPQAVPIKVVSGRPESAAETIKVLTDVGINASFTWFDGGFTNFILKRGIDEFLGSS